MIIKPIPFAREMAVATDDRRKTQTRRGLKLRGYDGFFQFGKSDTPGYDWHFRRKDHVWEDYRHNELLALLKYQAGDLLWVKEPHWAFGHWETTDELTATGQRKRRFVRNQARDVLFCAPETVLPMNVDGKHGWYARHGMFMQKMNSRNTLRVTDVRVQRVQDVSAEDIKAEGITWWQNVRTHHKQGVPRYETGWSWDYPLDGNTPVFGNMYVAFSSLWNSINGADAWDANDWVAAYTYETIKTNVSQMKEAA